MGNLYTGESSILLAKTNRQHYIYSRKDNVKQQNAVIFMNINTNDWYEIVATFDSANYKKILNINGKQEHGTYNSGFEEATTHEFTVFRGGTNTSIEKFNGKIKYVRIYQEDILKLNLIPVLDKNNVACMYDKVNSKFYYNSGTGDFLYGEKES